MNINYMQKIVPLITNESNTCNMFIDASTHVDIAISKIFLIIFSANIVTFHSKIPPASIKKSFNNKI